MADTIQNAVTKLMAGYPIGSQEDCGHPVVSAVLVDVFGQTAWLLAEYDPETNCAFGYVSGLYLDEWGFFLLDGFEELRIPGGGPMIVVDEEFEPMTIGMCWIKHRQLFRKNFPG